MTLPELAALPVGISNITLGSLVTAILTLVICLVVIRLLSRLLRRLLERSRLEQRARGYVLTAVRGVLYVITALVVVDCLGVPITSLVALISVGSLGLTLAAEDILGNMAGGFIILSSHPFAVGDFVEIGGVSGTVTEISLHHTRLRTPGGQLVSVPNRTVSGSQVTNHSSLGRLRVTRRISAAYGAATETVKEACRAALFATPKVLFQPESEVHLADFGSSAIEYVVFCWCLPGDYWEVYYALGENLRTAFRDAGVEMTYDHLNVHIEK